MQRWYIAIFGIHAPGRATSTCPEDRSWHPLGGNPMYLGFSANGILPCFQIEEVELLTIAHPREMKGIQNRWRKEFDTSPSESER